VDNRGDEGGGYNSNFQGKKGTVKGGWGGTYLVRKKNWNSGGPEVAATNRKSSQKDRKLSYSVTEEKQYGAREEGGRKRIGTKRQFSEDRKVG